MADVCKPRKNPETGSRWKEDKVLTITGCLKGDGADLPPKKLLTTCLTATSSNTSALAEELVTLLWEGKIDPLPGRLRELSVQAGEPLESDGATHPRQVLRTNINYFEKHRDHTDYPTYRAKGWPIGSGITESGVKFFGKRVKGTEQFWTVHGAGAILALRSKWLSEDEHSTYYWLMHPSKARAA